MSSACLSIQLPLSLSLSISVSLCVYVCVFVVVMADPTEEALEAIKAMGLNQDDDTIRDTLHRCNNNIHEAVQLLLPESPTTERNIQIIEAYTEGYTDLAPPYHQQRGSPQESDVYDVDMKDTETQPGSGADSDHDSTTVSYSLEEDAIRDVVDDEEEEEEVLVGRQLGRRSQMDDDGEEFHQIRGTGGNYGYNQMHGRRDVPPPRYEDIMSDNQEVSSPREGKGSSVKRTTPTPPEVVGSGDAVPSIEFPLTHYYELEGRVHTNQWSIPYKRDESLAICMLATIKMVKEGEQGGVYFVRSCREGVSIGLCIGKCLSYSGSR